MADRIAVISEGHLQAFESPDELYNKPKTLFVAGFVGNPPMNFVSVEVAQIDDIFFAKNETFSLTISKQYGERAAAHHGEVVMGIRPEDISIDSSGEISGEIFVVEPLGRENLIDVRVGNTSYHVLVDPELQYSAG